MSEIANSPKLFSNEITELCKTPDTCYMDLSKDDRYFTESLDERVSDLMESIETAANAWGVIAENVAFYINKSREEFEHYYQQLGASRNVRRISERDRESLMGQGISHAHNAAISATGTGLLEGVFVQNLVAEGAPPKESIIGLEKELIELQKKRTHSMGIHRIFALEDELTNAFQFEYLSRAYMQLINDEAPEVLQAMFDPSSITDLPSSLQRLAALDISKGMGVSVLLDNAAKYCPGDQSESTRLADYIRENNLPEGVKKSLYAIKIGMQAMGAPTCPFNDLGICTHLLAKIPGNQYPEDLQRDMATRTNQASQKRIDSLIAFAKRNPTSKILNSSTRLNENTTANNSPSRKRAPMPKLDKRDFIMAEQAEIVMPKITRVKFRFANNDTVIETASKYSDELEDGLDEIFDQDMIKDYTDKYHDDKLLDMLVGAVTFMAIAPTYIGTNRMVTPWVDMKNNAHINEEGVKERFMRYSGARAVGVSGGPVGKDTRIIFSQGTKDGVRHITIHKIIHKADIKSNVTFR